jgi:hypothetical protein
MQSLSFIPSGMAARFDTEYAPCCLCAAWAPYSSLSPPRAGGAEFGSLPSPAELCRQAAAGDELSTLTERLLR